VVDVPRIDPWGRDDAIRTLMKRVFAICKMEHLPDAYTIASSDDRALIKVERVEPKRITTSGVEHVGPLEGRVLRVVASGANRRDLA
jgi:hypothetical protein